MKEHIYILTIENKSRAYKYKWNAEDYLGRWLKKQAIIFYDNDNPSNTDVDLLKKDLKLGHEWSLEKIRLYDYV